MDERSLVLHGLRLKGFAEAPAIGAAVGLEAADVEEQLTKLEAEGLAVHREGRLSGWTLTRDGRVEQQRVAQEDLAPVADEVRPAYEAFLGLNDEFKVLCTDWQLRDGAVYDHSDPSYNQAIVERLEAIDGSLAGVLDRLVGLRPRYGEYRPRFAGALTGFRAGDHDLLTKPIIDSYHTIWFELHEDLLTGLGIDRSQEGST